jgi:microcystin-dependent protein
MKQSTITSRWNADLIDEKYDAWLANPDSIDSEWRAFFEGFELAQTNGSSSHSKNGASTAPATSEAPQDKVVAEGVGTKFYSTAAQDRSLAGTAIKPSGGSRAHTNLMPALCVHFIISLFGIYPSRH